MEIRTVRIMLVSLVQKNTNLIGSLDYKSDPVRRIANGTTFRRYFVSDDNEKISDENIYVVVDKGDADAQKCIFRMRFTF